MGLLTLWLSLGSDPRPHGVSVLFCGIGPGVVDGPIQLDEMHSTLTMRPIPESDILRGAAAPWSLATGELRTMHADAG